MAPVRKEIILMKLIQHNRRQRRQLNATVVAAIARRRLIYKSCFLMLLLLVSRRNEPIPRKRSCRRLPRCNTSHWWENIRETYSDDRFKKTFRVSKRTFNFLLSHIREELQRETVCEEPVSPECRLAICLYRLGRGDYIYTIAEMVGLGQSTVTTIINEVNKAIVKYMWTECVSSHMPATEEQFKEKILDMEELWQFPFSWAAVDGCHIPIKCPPGGNEACKEFHNFKNFFSVVLMPLVDAKYRFIWGSCGFPGNSHDSIILQSTSLWKNIKDGLLLPNFMQREDNVLIPPILLGDSAFPFETWLMKPFSKAVLSKEETNFNYRLSRARMVVEGAYGQLKGRWRLLLRKPEGGLFQIKMATLACMILHNVCLDQGDTIPSKLDLSIDPVTRQVIDRTKLREILMMKSSRKVVDPSSTQATVVRKVIVQRLWDQKQNANN
eukprot:Seg2301.2 transcript_id=Seg2301.2/GoldUCD/mRNA.D3Y31 product="Protein ALP1-like" protein_id=Seg2301.2/GoldUCD/D3Y31